MGEDEEGRKKEAARLGEATDKRKISQKKKNQRPAEWLSACHKGLAQALPSNGGGHAVY